MDFRKVDTKDDITDVDEYVRGISMAVMNTADEFEKNRLIERSAELAGDAVFRFLLKRWMRCVQIERDALECGIRSKVLASGSLPPMAFDHLNSTADTCYKAMMIYSLTRCI